MALKFGTSGVRGLVTEMTDQACALYTTAFVDYLKRVATGEKVVIGGDHRSSTPRILRAVAHAIRTAGGEPVFVGYLPTSAVMYHAMRHDYGSIMVTGSHIPDDRNGIKFNLPWGEVLKQDEEQLSKRFAELEAENALADHFDANGNLREEHVVELGEPLKAAAATYLERYQSFFPGDCLAGRKIVVYQHSAVIREMLPALLESLGAEVVPVGWSDDFVPVDTEAVDRPEMLAAWVKEHGADALVTADGDSDRPLVVDEEGQVIRGDVLGIVVAQYLGADAVATPVSCNTAAELSNSFALVYRTRIGSPYVIAAMNEAVEDGHETVVGYEANGGFLLGTDIGDLTALPTRDAALPILAILHAAAREDRPVSSLISELPSRYTASGLLREVPNAAGKAFVKRLELMGPAIARQLFEPEFGEIESWDHTDGARMRLTDGRILHLRPSGNAPEFRLYTEADSEKAAQDLNDAAAPIVRETLHRLQDTGSVLPPEQQRLANIDAMNACPANGTGMDVIIVSTTNEADARYWQQRLEAGRGQVTNQNALILAVHEDWPGGAGNGLGTLYALHKARAKARERYHLDLYEKLAKGAAIALYHTAGKGTRMAPLPASESNNKPAIKLPGLLEIDGKPHPITVLEAVIKQTGIYAASRHGRLSVFWGDQVFIPSTDPIYEPRHHADIVGQLGPMPDAEQWEARRLDTYGLLAVGAEGNTSQVEKVSHAEATELIERGAISVENGIGVSIGSFSMSSPLALGLVQEFATEIHQKRGKLDTDPHFWMPMTLDRETYLQIMRDKGEDASHAASHYARMSRFAEHLHEVCDCDLGLLGALNIGTDSYWWDYGQLPLYQQNLMLALEDSTEGEAVRRFFGLQERQRHSDCGDSDIDSASCVLASKLQGGTIRHSLIVGVEATHLEADHAIIIEAQAPVVKADHAIAYNLRADQDVELSKGQVRADIPLPDKQLTMRTHLERDGRADWQEVHSGNPCSYDDLHRRVHDALSDD